MLNYTLPLDDMFHCLADPTRRAMVERLARGNATVKQLAEPFSMSLPAIMQHLQALEASSLVVSQKTGRVRTCSLNRETFVKAEAWFADRRKTWESMLDRMVEIAEAQETQHGQS